MQRRTVALALLLVASAVPGTLRGQDMMSTTAPASSSPAEDQATLRLLGIGLDRIESYVNGLGLDEQVAGRAKAAIADARDRATKLAARRGESPAPDVRAEALAIARDARQRVAAMLEPKARARLPDLVNRLERRDRPAARPAAVAVEPRPAPPASRPATVAVEGEPFPPFRLTRLDGKLVTNESLMGRPAVVVFGSWSSPGFRDQAPRLADLAARYGGRVNWLYVYTREMFPSTDDPSAGPERNRDDKVAIAAHASDDDRRTVANRMLEATKLRLDVAPDAMDDRLTEGAGAFPSAAFVLDAKGTILLRLDYAEPFAIKRALDAALSTKRTPNP